MFKYLWRSCATVALLGGLGACAQTDLQQQLSAAEGTDAQAQLSTMSGQPGAVPAGGDFGPANAKPGECYARVTTQPQFKTVSERVVESPASENLRVIPAQYATVTERVVTREASERVEVVPATYKTVTERVVVDPERTHLVKVPAEYRTETRQIKVRDAYTAWKPGGRVYAVGAKALGGQVLENRTSETGDVMCLVEVPAEYKTVTERVLVKPEAVREEVTSAKFRNVERRVIDQPATTKRVAIPAKYGTIEKTVLKTAARTETTPIAETYRTIERQVETAPSQTAWTTVLCDVNATPDIVRKLQTALRGEGVYRGPVDGKIGAGTQAAIRAYQTRQGVQSDILTMESASKLGLTI